MTASNHGKNNEMKTKLKLTKGVHYKNSIDADGTLRITRTGKEEFTCICLKYGRNFNAVDAYTPFVLSPDVDLSEVEYDYLEAIYNELGYMGEHDDEWISYGKFSLVRKGIYCLMLDHDMKAN